MKHRATLWLVFLFCLMLSGPAALADKTVYIPHAFRNDPALREWSYDRSYQTDNFVIFWGPRINTPPTEFPDERMRFDPVRIGQMLESFYALYVDEIGFVDDNPQSNLGKYKLMVLINDTWAEGGPSGWAFGAGYDGVIGAMWVHPGATRDGGVISHELAHGLQLMVHVQHNTGGGGYINNDALGFFWECHAEFMSMQANPGLAGNDLPRWMATSSFHWSSTRHHYTSDHLLWALQHAFGIELINRMWLQSRPNEHPLMTLRRLRGWDQADLNDFIYTYAARQVTCDYPVKGFGKIMRRERDAIAREQPHLLWRLWTVLEAVDADAGHYVVSDASAPQDYGFNMIPLHPTDGYVDIRFKGHTAVNNTAGWRYGLVVVTGEGDDEQVRYVKPQGQDEGRLRHQVRAPDERLYLVVVGAPTQHTTYPWEPGWPKIKRYPYELLIDGAVPEGHQEGFRSRYKVDGAPHPNGGGWVARSAEVAPSVFVGPRAVVMGSSTIRGNARIDGTAWVEDTDIAGGVVIDGNAHVCFGRLRGRVHATHNAILMQVNARGRARFQDNAKLWGNNYSGDVVVGGDAEIASADSGVYLQVPHGNNGRTANDGAGREHPANQEVNRPVQRFNVQDFPGPH